MLQMVITFDVALVDEIENESKDRLKIRRRADK